MTKNHLRDELIQAAAVCIAIVEDLDYGQADAWRNVTEQDYQGSGVPMIVGYQMPKVLQSIRDERERQDLKWGPQHRDIFEWMAILMEEVGEAAQAALKWALIQEDAE